MASEQELLDLMAEFGSSGGVYASEGSVFRGPGDPQPALSRRSILGVPVYGGFTSSTNRTSGVSEANLDIFRTPEDIQNLYGTDLQSLQVDLYSAGFYGRTDPDDIGWGAVDHATQVAWERAVDRASRYYAAGQELTIPQVIALTRQQGGAGLGSDGDGGRGAESAISLSSPKGLASRMDQIAQAVVGRKATADERRMFIRLIHDAQASQQRALQGGGTATAVDVDAEAEFMLREQNPLEAEGNDFASVMNTFEAAMQQLEG